MYITVKKGYVLPQLSFDDILNGVDFDAIKPKKDTKDTQTYLAKSVSEKNMRNINLAEMTECIRSFNVRYKKLVDLPDKSVLYRSFKIPKRTGGLRQIDAPNEELYEALNDLKDILENVFAFTHHTAAFAYVRGRSTIDAVRRHQENKSRWILKTDLSKFFPNTTPEFLMSMLAQTFPLSVLLSDETFKSEFEKAMSLCFLRGGLPQGTPTSPMLTNQMMIPIDYQISKMCHKHTPHLCYTRYADDMHISSEYDFVWSDVVNEIGNIMKSFNAPFDFNREKIHYGNTNGRNWMLGVMLNKDGNITIGHENKKTFKTSLFAFGNSIKDGKPWNVEDTQHLQGLYSYYKMVEGDTIDALVDGYSAKFKFNLLDKMKEVIRNEVQ